MSAALERLLPRYQFVERHRILVSAPVAEVYAAVVAMDLADSSIARTLMALWRIPARVILGNVPDRPMSVRDFLQLHEHPPTDLVRGMIGGRVNRAQVAAMTADDFIAFNGPAAFKLAWGFHLTVCERSVLVETETRVFCTDADSRAWFRWYWLVIRLPSGLIRRRLLASIKRRAERS